MIELKVEATQIEAWIKGVMEGLPENFRPSFQRIAFQVLASVQRKLSGEVLQVRSGKLLHSAHARVETTTDSIAAIVQAGALAPYAWIHEYGATVTVPEHMSTSRLGKKFVVQAHQAVFPERSYMRTSLTENQAWILDEIDRAMQKLAA